jgi:hypothetical protein
MKLKNVSFDEIIAALKKQGFFPVEKTKYEAARLRNEFGQQVAIFVNERGVYAHPQGCDQKETRWLLTDIGGIYA